MIWTWPTAVLYPQAVTVPRLAPRSLSGGASISGKTQIIASDAGVWVASFKSVPIHDRTTYLAWSAVEAYCDGRLNAIDVPLFGYYGAYQPFEAGLDYETLLAGVPHSDGSLFSDGSGYAGAIIDVAVSGALSLGATLMTVTVIYGPRIEPGQVFSIGHTNKGPRWYQIKSFDIDTGAMTFRPPLREAVADGTALNFDRPTCRMRLAADDSMKLDLVMPANGYPSVDFVEDL